MATQTILVATWDDGVFVFTGGDRRHELRGERIAALAPDGLGGTLAIVGGHSLRRRPAAGEWAEIVATEASLACCVAVDDAIYAGTDDARVLRVSANGDVEPLRGFEHVAGRDDWYAGSAIVDGQVVGPPLGIRSMAATADGTVLLANVHVGGIPRSSDGGATWQPTIAIESDVHEVCAHAQDPALVIAAAAVGFCASRDGGATWTIDQDGLHAAYCSAVAFLGGDVLVAASTDHFATDGSVYRRPVDASRPFARIGDGLPDWFDGIVDTRGIGTRGTAAAIADRGGHLYVSTDTGKTWSCLATGLPFPSSVVVL